MVNSTVKVFESEQFSSLPEKDCGGVVYVLEFNKGIKIGATSDPRRRVKEWTISGNYFSDQGFTRVAITPFHENYFENEHIMHSKLQDYRDDKKEIFFLGFDKAIVELEQLTFILPKKKHYKQKNIFDLPGVLGVLGKQLQAGVERLNSMNEQLEKTQEVLIFDPLDSSKKETLALDKYVNLGVSHYCEKTKNQKLHPLQENLLAYAKKSHEGNVRKAYYCFFRDMVYYHNIRLEMRKTLDLNENFTWEQKHILDYLEPNEIKYAYKVVKQLLLGQS